MSLNRVFIMGNLGQDPELRYTPSQTPVVTMSVATTDVRSVDGQKQEQTEWHRVVVWGKQAENCAKYLKKGRTVFVEGKMQTRTWEDKNGGGKRYTTEVIANNVRFVGGGASRSEHDNTGHAAGYAGGGGDDYAPSTGSFDAGFGGPSTPSLDDIPF
jgi:single-strand DNA-binding protein